MNGIRVAQIPEASNPPPQTLGCRTHEGKCAGLASACLSTAKSENCSQFPQFRGGAVSAVVDSHHQYSKNQPFSVGFFSPIPASAGADSGHGLASAIPPNPVFSPPSTPLCSPFSLVVSRACARVLPVLARVCRGWVVAGNSCSGSDRKCEDCTPADKVALGPSQLFVL